MTSAAFTTEILERDNLLVGPWRSPKQILTRANAQFPHARSMTMLPHRNWGFRAAPSRGRPISASSRPCASGSGARSGSRPDACPYITATPPSRVRKSQANIEKPKPGRTTCVIGMTKRDGTEILRGTASVGGDGTDTALGRRLGELKPLAISSFSPTSGLA